MALAAVVLVLAGVTAGLAALRGAQQTAWSSDVDGRLQAGLRQGELLALAWLNADAARAVLPPEGGGLLLVDDRFVLPGGEGRLCVVAYDGLAGIPACQAQRGGALRTALPTALMSLAIPPISPAQAESSSYLLDVLELPAGVRRFPRGFQGTGRIWRSARRVDPIDREDPPATEPSLAETIAFHSDGRINLNTAPAAVLRTAYGVLHLGGLEEVLERRRLLTTSRPPEIAPGTANGLRLVAQSDRWQMLVSVRWQDIRRSWWVDFAGKPGAFSMVQRHDASD